MPNSKNAVVSSNYVPGSLPLDGRKERFARYRAEGLPSLEAYRKAAYKRGYECKRISNGNLRYTTSAWQWDNDPRIIERIQYLINDVVELTRKKRARLEEKLWSIHEASIGDYLDSNDKPIPISQLDREHQQNIEELRVSASGKLYPKLYSRITASQELRKMLGLERAGEASQVSRLSDAELVSQLADQARELGVEIKLDYTFASAPIDAQSEAQSGEVGSQVIDNAGVGTPVPPAGKRTGS